MSQAVIVRTENSSSPPPASPDNMISDTGGETPNSEAILDSASTRDVSHAGTTSDGQIDWVCAHLSLRLAVAEGALEREKTSNQELRDKIIAMEREAVSVQTKVTQMEVALEKKAVGKRKLPTHMSPSITTLNRFKKMNTDLKEQIATLARAHRGQRTRGDLLQAAADRSTAEQAEGNRLLAESQLEIARLRQEVSAHASLVPASTRTEEEYFGDVLSLNQMVKDLANHLTRDDTIKHHFAPMGTRKQQRICLQHWLNQHLWRKIFSRLLASLDGRSAEEELEWIVSGIEPHHLPFWKSILFVRIERDYSHREMLQDIMERFVQGLGRNKALFSRTSMGMLEAIVGLAFQIQFSIGKQGKNVSMLYGREDTLFDPLIMEDMEQPDPNDGEDNTAAIHTDSPDHPHTAMFGSTQVVACCTGFGVQGSAGVEQKCSVFLA